MNNLNSVTNQKKESINVNASKSTFTLKQGYRQDQYKSNYLKANSYTS